jgi:hypothetical protein
MACAFEFFLLSSIPSLPVLFIGRIISGLGDVGLTNGNVPSLPLKSFNNSVITGYTIITDLAKYNKAVVSHQYGESLSYHIIFGAKFSGHMHITQSHTQYYRNVNGNIWIVVYFWASVWWFVM